MYWIGAIVAIILFGWLVYADASFLNNQWENVTVFDGYLQSGNTWWGNTNEDQETEPGTSIGQDWDLEGFFYNDKKDDVALVGGFDFVGGNDWVGSGDIFIDTDTSTNYYDYVMDLDFQNNGKYTFTVYQNNGTIAYDTTHGGPAGQTQGQPWVMSNPGTATIVQGYDNIAMKYINNKSDKQIGGGLTGGKHNAVVVDVSFLNGSGYNLYNAIECGNDITHGQVGGGASGQVPEPITLVLMGTGLLYLGIRRRKHNGN